MTAPFTASSRIHLRNLFECFPVCLPRSLSADSLSSGRTPAYAASARRVSAGPKSDANASGPSVREARELADL